jgi:divalent metal cation (Fe/Co/Zn/Cd) transporter
MPTKVTKKSSKVAPVRKAEAVKKVPPSVPAGNKFWLALAGLIVGGLSFIGYALLSNLNLNLSENFQVASIFVMAVLAIAGVVLAILGFFLGKEAGNAHNWLSLNIIAFVVSFVMFEKLISLLISVVTYILNK